MSTIIDEFYRSRIRVWFVSTIALVVLGILSGCDEVTPESGAQESVPKVLYIMIIENLDYEIPIHDPDRPLNPANHSTVFHIDLNGLPLATAIEDSHFRTINQYLQNGPNSIEIRGFSDLSATFNLTILRQDDNGNRTRVFELAEFKAGGQESGSPIQAEFTERLPFEVDLPPASISDDLAESDIRDIKDLVTQFVAISNDPKQAVSATEMMLGRHQEFAVRTGQMSKDEFEEMRQGVLESFRSGENKVEIPDWDDVEFVVGRRGVLLIRDYAVNMGRPFFLYALVDGERLGFDASFTIVKDGNGSWVIWSCL